MIVDAQIELATDNGHTGLVTSTHLVIGDLLVRLAGSSRRAPRMFHLLRTASLQQES